jgi:sucrose-6-phosphate hydrolase SacC (GH32 family)
MLVVVGTGTPASSDVTAMSNWLWQNYGIITGPSYNAPNYSTMPNRDYNGISVSDAIELGAVYNPSGIFGHKYWMASAPFDSNFPSENPNIAFSDDGNTWMATGITNPIVAYPGGGNAGNNADPCLFDNTSRDGTLYCLYVRENASLSNGVRYATSTNGTTWTDQGFLITGSVSTGPYFECPVMAYDSASGKYWLYTMSIATPSAAVIYRQASSSVTGSWSLQTACTITVPGGRKPWHISAPIKIGSKWVLATSDSPAPRNLWLASSTDGLNWTCATKPFVVPATSNEWDAPGTEGLYRPSIQDAGDGKNLLLWYVSNGSNANYISQMVTVPQAVIP